MTHFVIAIPVITIIIIVINITISAIRYILRLYSGGGQLQTQPLMPLLEAVCEHPQYHQINAGIVPDEATYASLPVHSSSSAFFLSLLLHVVKENHSIVNNKRNHHQNLHHDLSYHCHRVNTIAVK
jgi:hypothetical protein